MNKILRYSFVALLAMVFGNVMADDVTFTPSDFTPVESSDYSATKNGVTVSVTASTVTAEQMRVFKGKTITISSAVGNITQAVFTCTANGTAKYGPGCFAAPAVGEYTFESEGKTGTWTGDAAEFSLTAETNQVRVTELVVTVGGAAPTVAAPKFSVPAGTYYDPQTVKLTCDTEGAKILYTIPAGQDPVYVDDENYTGVFYDGTPLTITQTTTIKAMAVKDGQTSSIVSATYTIAEIDEVTVAQALDIINALDNGAKTTEEYKVTGYVTTIDEISLQYGNATFDIADAQGGSPVLKIFRAKDANGENITDENIVKVGDLVVAQGLLQKYVKNEAVTPEMAQGGKILTVNGQATGIETVKVNSNFNGKIYNMAGQVVNKGYKGLVIMNGKKMLQK